MAKPEPFVALFWPESTREAIHFHISILPKWIQLYLVRFAERRGFIEGHKGD